VQWKIELHTGGIDKGGIYMHRDPRKRGATTRCMNLFAASLTASKFSRTATAPHAIHSVAVTGETLPHAFPSLVVRSRTVQPPVELACFAGRVCLRATRAQANRPIALKEDQRTAGFQCQVQTRAQHHRLAEFSITRKIKH
jgi:hypothetical protein